MKLPREDYLDGEVPRCFFISRESYERLLRGLVRSSSKIKWVVGTAIGLKMASESTTNVNSVVVRLPSGKEQELSAALVIGKV